MGLEVERQELITDVRMNEKPCREEDRIREYEAMNNRMT